MSDEEKAMNKEAKSSGEYEYKELAAGWWHELDWILPGREKEPNIYELFHDMMIGSIVGNPVSLEIASKMVPRIILIEIEHPQREIEYVRVMINPTDLKPGIPDTEPDLIIHMLYYDFVRILTGEIDMMAPIWAGNGWILGNLTCGLDLRDLLAASTDKDVQRRPAMWPLGSP
jgi:putative sterol carrier protein